VGKYWVEFELNLADPCGQLNLSPMQQHFIMTNFIPKFIPISKFKLKSKNIGLAEIQKERNSNQRNIRDFEQMMQPG